MTRGYKVLLGVFIVLLLVTVGEVVYVLFFLPKKSVAPQANTSNLPTPQSQSLPTSSPQPTIDPHRLFNEYELDNIRTAFRYIKRDTVVSLTNTTEVKGKITELNTQGGSDLYFGVPFEYEIKLTLEGSEGSQTPLFFTQEMVNIAQVFDATSGSREEIGFEDLRVGDTITIKTVSDYTKAAISNISQLEVTKN